MGRPRSYPKSELIGLVRRKWPNLTWPTGGHAVTCLSLTQRRTPAGTTALPTLRTSEEPTERLTSGRRRRSHPARGEEVPQLRAHDVEREALVDAHDGPPSELATQVLIVDQAADCGRQSVGVLGAHKQAARC